MIIIKPFIATIEDQYTTSLQFENGVIKPFYMRGSISVPEGKKEGFAMMAGMDLREGQIIIFDQFRWCTVSHWRNPDGTVREREDGSGYYLGLMKFITDNFALYKCASYFYGGQHYDQQKRYLNEVYRHPEASRRMELIEVPYVAETGPDLLIEKLKTNRFKAETGSWLHESVARFVAMRTTETDYDNATLCLMTLLTGFDYQPHVKIRGGYR